MRPPRYPRARSSRAGFTLAEVLVAIVLVDVALLALVASSVVVLRDATDGRLRIAAVRAASDRLQLLTTAPCAAASGSAPRGLLITEHWSVDAPRNSVRDSRDSVTFVTRGVEHAVVLRTRVPC